MKRDVLELGYYWGRVIIQEVKTLTKILNSLLAVGHGVAGERKHANIASLLLELKNFRPAFRMLSQILRISSIVPCLVCLVSMIAPRLECRKSPQPARSPCLVQMAQDQV